MYKKAGIDESARLNAVIQQLEAKLKEQPVPASDTTVADHYASRAWDIARIPLEKLKQGL